MGRRRRFLVLLDLCHAWATEFLKEQERLLAERPAAAAFTDEEAEDFLLAAASVDQMAPEDTRRVLRIAGVAPPLEIAYDSYRMGRYLFRRWLDPGVKEGFLQRGMYVPAEAIARVRRRGRTADLFRTVEEYGFAAAFALFRYAKAADLILVVKAAMSPEQMAEYEASLRYGKVRLHQFLTEPEPARVPTHWEQQKLLRRIRLRSLQLRSMSRSRLNLDSERATLKARLQQLRQRDQPELKSLAVTMEELRVAQADVEREHREALARRAAAQAAQLAPWQAEVAAAEAAYHRVLALRRTLLGVK